MGFLLFAVAGFGWYKFLDIYTKELSTTAFQALGINFTWHIVSLVIGFIVIFSLCRKVK